MAGAGFRARHDPPERLARAWTPVFDEIEALSGEAGEARLGEMAAGFWRDNAYQQGEPDRVVLFVALRAEREGQAVWHKGWVMDASGDRNGSAMAQLVSTPVALAIEAVRDGKIVPGVHAAPEDADLIAGWLAEIGKIAQHLKKVDHLG